MKSIIDLFDRVGRALRPAEPVQRLPTPEDFELLLHRFEREFTIAYTACVWRNTWLELVALSNKLFADKGDLCEFYAVDHAEDLIRSRRIEGIGEDIRECVEGGTIRTFESVVASYIRLEQEGSWVADPALSNLAKSVSAYSPDDITRIELYERVLEVLRRAGADLHDDDRAVRRLHDARYSDRLERYRREREEEKTQRSGSVVATDPTRSGDESATDG